MRKIITIVLGIHLGALLWMALWLPTKPVKKTLCVRTTVVKTVEPLAVAPVLKKAPPPTPSATSPSPAPAMKAKATVAKKTSPIKKIPAQKPRAVPAHLLKDLENAIAKIDQKSHKEEPRKQIAAPKMFTALHIEEEMEESFATKLTECLQRNLNLPERGEVKIELTLSKEGKFVKMVVLESASSVNQTFLEKELKKISFPAFEGVLRKENEHAFVLAFCHR